VSEAGFYIELVRPDISVEELKRLDPKGITLSGGRAAGM